MFRITEIRTFDKPDYNLASDFLDRSLQGKTSEAEEEMNSRLQRYNSVMKVLEPNQVFRLVSPETPTDFFDRGMNPRVNISAIVGENGMGKSSLVELMIRLINNTAYALRSGLVEAKDFRIRFVRDIYASLTFENPSGFFTIEQRDRKIKLTHDNKGEVVWCFDFDKRHNENGGLVTQENSGSRIPQKTIRVWLSKLFYTIVINYSAYGNNTRDLTHEYTYYEELEEEEKKNPKIVDENTRIWMHNIFHKNDAYQLPLVLTPFRKGGNIDNNTEKDLTRDRLLRLANMTPSPLDDVIEGKVPKLISLSANERFRCDRFYSRDGVHVLSQGLSQECQWLIKNNSAHFDSVVVDFAIDIIRIWSDLIGLDLIALAEDLNNKAHGDGERALSYLVYKTVKIARNYVTYSNLISEDLRGLFSYHEEINVGDESKRTEYKSKIRDYLKSLLIEKTHISLKLRRTLALLIFRHYFTSQGKIEIKEFSDKIVDLVDNQCDKIKDIREEYRYREYTGEYQFHYWEEEELMPCPSDRFEIVFVTKEGKCVDEYTLSSGEQQMISVLTAVIYHLYNLKSLFGDAPKDDDKVRYPNVNIIFEEAELYFHPKYQTLFIDALLKAIKGLELDNKITAINLIFVTHSPFLLSDIPDGNILYMKYGAPESRKKRTFCANVYDLLADSFFMSKFVGEFAYNKIGHILEDLENKRNLGDRAVSLRKDIELIGDDFIRQSLLMRYESGKEYPDDSY